jgi:protease I
MANELQGVRVAFLATDGVEQVELQRPWEELERAGAHLELISCKSGRIQAMNHDDKGDTFDVDGLVADADAEHYDALVMPGGVANPDRLRTDDDVRDFVRGFFESGRPVAAICHAPWTLIDAGVVAGRTLTSWPTLQVDLRNAGARWVDEETCLDGQLLTSRGPADLPAFIRRAIDLFGRTIETRAGGSAAVQRGGRVRIDRSRDGVDDSSQESFPASDAPPGPAAP